MPTTLSVDLRQRVVRAVQAGASRHQAADRFGVSLASASRWCGRFARDGHVAPKRHPSVWAGISAPAGSRLTPT